MRVWDFNVSFLCDKHLIAQHKEIGTLITILVAEELIAKYPNEPLLKIFIPIGWVNHPETNRWRGQLAKLVYQHNITAQEMVRRGFRHNTPINLPVDTTPNSEYVHTLDEQYEILRRKKCSCRRPSVTSGN